MGEKRRSGRGLKVAAAILMTLVALGLVVLGVGRLVFDDARMRALAEREVDAALAGEVSIGAFRWDPFPVGGVAEDMVLRDLDGRVVLEIPRARIRVDPGGLVRRTVRITHLRIDRPRILLVEDEAGAFTLAEALAPAEPAEDPTDRPWTVRARDVMVVGARVSLMAEAVQLELHDLDVGDGRLDLVDRRLTVEAHARARGLDLSTDAVTLSAGPSSAEAIRLETAPWPDRGAVSVARMSADVGGSTVTGAGGLVGLAAEAELRLAFDVEADLDLTHAQVYDALPDALRPHLAPAGQVQISARLRGRAEDPEVTASVVGRDLVVADVPVARAEGTGHWAAGRLTVETLDADLDPGRLRLEGVLDVGEDPPTWEARARLEDVSGDAFAAHVDASTRPGRISGTAGAHGRGVDPPTGTFEAELVLDGLPPAVVDALPPGARDVVPARADVSVQGASDGEILDLDRLEVVAGALAARAEGRIPLTSSAAFDLDFEAVHRAPNPLLEGLDLPLRMASASIDGHVTGTLPRPDAVGRLRLAGLSWDGAAPISVDAPFRLDGGVLHVTDAVAAGADARIELAGRLDLVDADGRFRDAPPLQATARIRRLVLDDLVPWPVEVQGVARGQIRVGGTLTAPVARGRVTAPGSTVADVALERASFDLAADRERLRVLHLEVVPEDGGRLTGEATFALAASRLSFDLAYADAAGTLDATGILHVDAGRVEDLRITGDDLVLAAVPGVGALPLDLDGRVSVDLVAEGALPAPEVRGRIRVTDLVSNGERIHRGRFLVQVGPLEDGAHAVGIGLPGALWVRARVDPGPPLVVSADADLEGFDLAWIAPALREAEIDARLFGDAEVAWQRDPARIEARLRLPELEIALADEVLRSRRPVTLHFDGETLTVDRIELEGRLGTLIAEGTVGETLDLMARGRFETALLAVAVPQIARAEGALSVDLRAEGPLNAPDLQGQVTAPEPVRLLPRGMLREVTLTALSARFSPDRVVLDHLEGEVIGGGFRASGEAALDGLSITDIDAAFSGEGLPVRAADLVAEVNVDLTLTGDASRATVAGSVDVIRGRYRQVFAVDAFSLVLPDASPLPAPEPSPLLERLHLDLRVTSVGAVDARAEAGAFALDMVLDADLQVGGTAAAPRLEGRVAATRGHVEMPQARLDLVRGAVDFVPTPDDPMNAAIDVLAEGEVIVPPGGQGMIEPTYFVSVGLEGSLEEMEITLSSQPALDRLEVLALLVTGRVAPGQISPGDGRHVESAMIFAGTRLAEPLTRAITERLEEVLNLDLFVAEVTAEGITFTAGAEVSRRLSLEGAFQQGFGDAGSMATARAQFLLSNVVFLEGSAESVAAEGGTTVSPAQEGSRGRLEIKARILGGG